MDIKPIETYYEGYHFRSRLEARWAVFFDALKIDWEYEKEGYDLEDAGWYLPDFWLPQVKTWAEVKPVPLTKEEIKKCDALSKMTGYPCLRLVGIPDNKAYYIRGSGDRDERFDLGYILTNYYLSDNRFWFLDGHESKDYGFNDYISSCGEDPLENTKNAVIAARSARFEHSR